MKRFFLLTLVVVISLRSGQSMAAENKVDPAKTDMAEFSHNGEPINPKCLNLLQPWLSESPESSIIIRSIVIDTCQSSNLAYSGANFTVDESGYVSYYEDPDDSRTLFKYKVLGVTSDDVFALYHLGAVGLYSIREQTLNFDFYKEQVRKVKILTKLSETWMPCLKSAYVEYDKLVIEWHEFLPEEPRPSQCGGKVKKESFNLKHLDSAVFEKQSSTENNRVGTEKSRELPSSSNMSILENLVQSEEFTKYQKLESRELLQRASDGDRVAQFVIGIGMMHSFDDLSKKLEGMNLIIKSAEANYVDAKQYIQISCSLDIRVACMHYIDFLEEGRIFDQDLASSISLRLKLISDLESHTKPMEMDPIYGELYKKLGQAYLLLHLKKPGLFDASPAQKALLRSIELWDRDSQAWLLLSDTYLRTGKQSFDIDKGFDALSRACELGETGACAERLQIQSNPKLYETLLFGSQ